MAALGAAAASRIPRWAWPIALGVTVWLAVAAGVAALARRLPATALGLLTVALLSGAALLSGEWVGWLGALGVIILAAGPGRLLGQLGGLPDAPPLITLALGLAAFSLLGFLTALAGTFSAWFFLAIGAASWALSLRLAPLRPGWEEWKGGGTCLGVPGMALVGGLWALLALLARVTVLPDCCSDAAWAHLPVAAAIAEGRNVAIPELWWTMIPHAWHALAAIAYTIGGAPAVGQLNFLFLLLNLSWAVWFGSRLHSLFAGLFAAALFVTVPLVAQNATAGNTDMGMVFLAAGAIAAFLHFRSTGRARWLLVVGILAGMAIVTKYFAGAVLIPLALVFVIERAGGRVRTVASLAFVLVTAGVAVTAGPWLVRTALLTGNPVFPAFNAYFQSPYWPARWEELPFRWFPWATVETLKLPFLLTFDASRLGAGAVPPEAMGTFPLLWLPVLLARWRTIGREGWYLLLVAAINFVLVFSLSQEPRYQLVTWLLLAIVLGVTLSAGIPATERGCRTLAVLVPVLALAGLGYFVVAWVSSYPPPAFDLLSGKISKHGYLRRTVPALDTFEHVRRLVPPDEKILTTGVWATWHAGRYLVPLRLAVVKTLSAPDLSRDEALAILREKRLRYFLAPDNQQHRLLKLGITRPMLRHGGFTLYEFAPPLATRWTNGGLPTG